MFCQFNILFHKNKLLFGKFKALPFHAWILFTKQVGSCYKTKDCGATQNLEVIDVKEGNLLCKNFCVSTILMFFVKKTSPNQV